MIDHCINAMWTEIQIIWVRNCCWKRFICFYVVFLVAHQFHPTFLSALFFSFFKLFFKRFIYFRFSPEWRKKNHSDKLNRTYFFSFLQAFCPPRLLSSFRANYFVIAIGYISFVCVCVRVVPIHYLLSSSH